jgi:hypothetical protein
MQDLPWLYSVHIFNPSSSSFTSTEFPVYFPCQFQIVNLPVPLCCTVYIYTTIYQCVCLLWTSINIFKNNQAHQSFFPQLQSVRSTHWKTTSVSKNLEKKEKLLLKNVPIIKWTTIVSLIDNMSWNNINML